jgi:hypothetical protein
MEVGGSVTMLKKFADQLLGVRISNIYRLGIASKGELIPLLSTLVLETDQRFLSLSYSQKDGFVCRAPVAKWELQWDGEIDDGEWLELANLEDSAEIPDLPFCVCKITGWFGIGSFSDLLVLDLEGDDLRLVVTTTHDALLCTNIDVAHGEAEQVARNHRMQLRKESLIERSPPCPRAASPE